MGERSDEAESPRKHWDRHYDEGETPWDTGVPEPLLVETVESWPVPACRALEIGCGTGTDAIWLARRGFEVTAVDVSAVAISRAREAAERQGVGVTWVAEDYLRAGPHAPPFDFAYDRGCVHTFLRHPGRVALVSAIARDLAPGGLWLSLVAAAEGPPRKGGPHGCSAVEVVTALDGHFQILSMRLVEKSFQSRDLPTLLFWACLGRRR